MSSSRGLPAFSKRLHFYLHSTILLLLPTLTNPPSPTHPSALTHPQGGLGPADYNLTEVKDWLAARYGMRGVSMPMQEVKMTKQPADGRLGLGVVKRGVHGAKE